MQIDHKMPIDVRFECSMPEAGVPVSFTKTFRFAADISDEEMNRAINIMGDMVRCKLNEMHKMRRAWAPRIWVKT